MELCRLTWFCSALFITSYLSQVASCFEPCMQIIIIYPISWIYSWIDQECITIKTCKNKIPGTSKHIWGFFSLVYYNCINSIDISCNTPRSIDMNTTHLYTVFCTYPAICNSKHIYYSPILISWYDDCKLSHIMTIQASSFPPTCLGI